MKENYNFKEMQDSIIGDFKIADYFDFEIHSNNAPNSSDIINIEGRLYSVYSIIDITDDEEWSQGLSYVKVTLKMI